MRLPGRRDSIRKTSLARLLDRGDSFVQTLLGVLARPLDFRQSSYEIVAVGALLVDSSCVRITEPGLFVEERRVGDQAIEPEIDRPERRLGLDDVITSTQLERQHREFFVPVGHDHDRNVELSGSHVFQDRKGLHTRMAVLDEHDLERKRHP